MVTDSAAPVATNTAGKIRCDACPVMCFIGDGKAGACDRYANRQGQLLRLDPHTIVCRTGSKLVPFLEPTEKALEHADTAAEIGRQAAANPTKTQSDTTNADSNNRAVSKPDNWDGNPIVGGDYFVTAVGAGTTYPDYKPAPFIVSQQVAGIDMVTVVTEGIYSYCGVKVKIDTDRHLGPEQANVRCDGEVVGHVTTGEYGSQMLSLGGVNHLTGGSKKEGRVTCDTLLNLCNQQAVELTIDKGSSVLVQAGCAPVVDGVAEHKMRVGCGSATVGMFAAQWNGLVDEVVVVDDHITGVMSEHQAGKVIGWQPSGIKILGRKSTPGRYFQVAEPGTGWGGTNIDNPLTILGDFNSRHARPGLSVLMVSTTGEHCGYYELDDNLQPLECELPQRLQQSVERIAENCEPALCSVMFMGGAGGSLRSGVTENPVQLTRSVKNMLTRVTCGGAAAYIWPGGGITLMVDVTRMPANSFGFVPTPALVAPVEFTLRLEDYRALGGHVSHITSIEQALAGRPGKQNDHALAGQRELPAQVQNAWPFDANQYRWPADNS